MKTAVSSPWRFIALYALVVVLGFSQPASAQTVSGQARAIQTSVVDTLGGITTTALADTGTLGGPTDAREASAQDGAVSSIIAGNTLHATTIGWADQVDSEASVSDLSIKVGVTTISANLVMAHASALLGLAGTSNVGIDGLSINGVAIGMTGTPNQTIAIPGGRVVINEQSASSAGTAVNALHVTVTGVADVVVASAAAKVQ